MKDKTKKQIFLGKFNIDDARTFAEINKVTRDTITMGYNDNRPIKEELIPTKTVKYILDQLEYYYVPEKFI